MPKKNTTSARDHSSILAQDIIVKGARQHNLKNITVRFPRNKFIVVTGVSGSGKSSLTLDTLYAEGQRKYAESLSSYARQFLGSMEKPDVDGVEGISPAIAIEQKVITRSNRSTVGSMTEIADFLRLLYARIGKTISPISGLEVKKDTVSDVVDFIKNATDDSKIYIAMPVIKPVDREVQHALDLYLQMGYTRMLFIKNENIDIQYIEDANAEDVTNVVFDTQYEKHCAQNAFILIDRVIKRGAFEEDVIHRLSDSVQTAYIESYEKCHIFVEFDGRLDHYVFNNKFERDGMVFEEPTPQFFSYNNPYGACPMCEGYSQVFGVDMDLVIPYTHLSIYEDAVVPWKGDKMSKWKLRFIKEEGAKGFPIHKPISELTEQQTKIVHKWVKAFFDFVDEQQYKIHYRIMKARFRGKTTCPECGGHRLRKEAQYVKIDGKSIVELMDLPISELKKWFTSLEFNAYEVSIAHRIFTEIVQRVDTMLEVGLHYLTLNRTAHTLSGGESQRIQITRFIGSNLSDSLYILDEPSIGLHPRDTANLINVLKRLRDKNNTVIVVEHDDQIMQEADYIIDMGPLAAHLGGEVIATGTYKELQKNPDSLTGAYLSGTLKVEFPQTSEFSPQAFITITDCHEHNLKHIDVSFPLNALCVVSGVSGSGKTTLVKRTLYPALMKQLGLGTDKPGKFHELKGDIDAIKHVELVDQNPIGKSSRSNPVTYIKAYDDIRALFAKQKAAQLHDLTTRHFSFNSDGGRCDKCKGDGKVLIDMQFLADIEMTCDVCNGQRFKKEVLSVKYNDKNITQVLDLSVDEAIEFFIDQKKLVEKLKTLQAVGLGYIKLGQSNSTLSGGEAQRIKLATYIGKGFGNEPTLFIFDEPTTGLHFHDINKLMKAFRLLIDKGHSLIVIEHNVDVIKHADWLIDIGPDGGANGGQLLFEGHPSKIVTCKESVTADYI